MNPLKSINEIMSTDLITVSRNDKLKDIESIFENNRIHHILVTEGEELVGIISEADFLLFKRGFNDNAFEDSMDRMRLRTHTAETVMSPYVVTLDTSASIHDAVGVFLKNQFHAIPVTQNSKLVGIVTTHDVLKAYDSESRNS